MKSAVKTKQTVTWTEDNIMVYQIDKDKLLMVINNVKNQRKNITYKPQSMDIGVVKTPSLSIIDTECCGMDWDGSPYDLYVYKHTKVKDGITFETIPSVIVQFTKEEFLSLLKPEPVSLRTFMGDRYDYNRRIAGNMFEWINHWNK